MLVQYIQTSRVILSTLIRLSVQLSLGIAFRMLVFPFGLIQVGPQSGNCSWDYTGGYQYKDTVLYGFSQTRVNGTGCPDLGDLLMLPYTGDMEQKEYASGYQKKNQFAEPGYYMVYLDDYEVNAENDS